MCAMALLMVACGGGGDDPEKDPVVSKDYINVAPNLQLLGDGQDTDLRITANCSWTITNSASWLSVSPSSGSNTETVRVSAGKNSTGSERTATLTIRGGNAPERRVMVTQAVGSDTPAAKTLSANVASLEFDGKGETKQFTISSNTSWNITKPEWCTLSKTSGNGNDEISVTVAENPNKEQRSGQIVISGEGVSSVTIPVTQKPKASDNTGEPGSGDNLPPT